MKKFYILANAYIAVFLILLCNNMYGQLKVSAENGLAEDLVKKFLAGDGVTISNVRFNGSTIINSHMLGAFDASNANIGIHNGILLTTGTIETAVGPNNLDDASSEQGLSGSTEIEKLLSETLSHNVVSYDACKLEFDFITDYNNLSFKYVFASEEYNEFVDNIYNDAFAFLVSGPGINDEENIALVPGTNDYVSIHNINNGRNLPYSRQSSGYDAKNPQYYIDNTYSDDRGIQYDGLTKVLTAQLKNIIPGETYHIKLIITDIGDDKYDSGVFLEAGSFSSVLRLNLSGIDTCTSTGNVVEYPVYYKINGTVNAGLTYKINYQLKFNKTMLYPVDTTNNVCYVGDTCIVNVYDTFKLSERNSKIVKLKTLFGNTAKAEIYTSSNDSKIAVIGDPIGSICVNDVCHEGGERLFDDSVNTSELLNVHPNPATDEITVHYSVNTNDRAHLYIVNYLGQKVEEFNINNNGSGEREFTTSLNELPSGTYYLIFDAPFRRMTKTIEVVK